MRKYIERMLCPIHKCSLFEKEIEEQIRFCCMEKGCGFSISREEFKKL